MSNMKTLIRKEFNKLTFSAGYEVVDIVTDDNKYFGVFFLRVYKDWVI